MAVHTTVKFLQTDVKDASALEVGRVGTQTVNATVKPEVLQPLR